MIYTTNEMIRVMMRSVLGRLERASVVEFSPESRGVLTDELYEAVKNAVVTEEGLRMMALRALGASDDELRLAASEAFTETEQYRAARRMVRAELGDDFLNGFYFQKRLREVAQLIIDTLMDSDAVDEVYEDDDSLRQRIVEIIQKFDPKQFS